MRPTARKRHVRQPNKLMWAKPVPIKFFRSILAKPDLSDVEFAVYIHGLLRSNRNGEFFSSVEGVERNIGHASNQISAARKSLCDKGHFARTGRYAAKKYPVFRVPFPTTRQESRTPIPIGLREEIHKLSPSALRLLLAYIVRGGWTLFGCILKYEPADKFMTEARLSRTRAFAAAGELREHGWIAIGMLQGELQRKFRTWDGVILVTKKAGFVKPPEVASWERHTFLTILGSGEPYNDFDLRDRRLWRSVQGALLERVKPAVQSQKRGS